MPYILMDYRYGKERMEYVFLDSEAQTLFLWKEEPREHYPYFYMRRVLSQEEKDAFGENLLSRSMLKKWHPLEKRFINAIKYETLNPQDVGSNAPQYHRPSQKLLEKLNMTKEEYRDAKRWAYEYYIKYYTRKTIDTRLIFGMPYEFKDGVPILSPQKDYRNDPVFTIMSDYSEELIQFFIPMFLEPIPKLNFVAIDIEVENRGSIIPDAIVAAEPMVSVALVYSDDRPARLLALRASAREVGKERSPELEQLIKAGKVIIEYFESEKPLLIRFFELLYEPGVPLIVDYNGDRFDLLYAAQRADFFGIQHNISWRLDKKTKIPTGTDFLRIHTDKGIKIHLDLYQFFARRYIQDYAFKNLYKQLGLEDVSQALLKRGKVKHEESIAELSIPRLLYYNYIDALLVKLLLMMRGGIVLNLIFLLMRLGTEPFSECHRKEISGKITNLFIRLCFERDWLMPTKPELWNVGTFSTTATSKGKQFEGAMVIDPQPGVHFGVNCRDFASLYPSMMKEHNISFETVNCCHEECMNNIVPETANPERAYAGHWICTIDRGLAADVAGFIRDIRVRYFKPLGKTDLGASAVEQMLKVFICSIWGVFGAGFFDFHTAPASESTISYARYSFRSLINKTVELGINPILGDTDSIFNKNETDEMVAALETFSKDELKLELGLDYEFQVLCTSKLKKNYIGVTIDGEIIEKGVIAKKSNTPPIFREAAKLIYECVKLIKDDRSLIEQRMRITNIIRKFYDMIWERTGNVGDYAYFTKMTKRVGEYKVMAMHVRAALIEADWIMRSLPPGSDLSVESFIQPGLLVAFVKGGKVRGSTKVKVTPVSIAKKTDINPQTYHAEFETMLRQIVGPLGIDVVQCRTDDPTLGKLDKWMPS